MPLREDAYRAGRSRRCSTTCFGIPETLRRRVAEKVGAGGTAAYSLLAAIGRDCVGAERNVTYVSGPDTGSVVAEEATTSGRILAFIKRV